jgi:hypothetical protein
MTQPPNVIQLATDYRAALARLELGASRRLVTAYGTVANRLTDLIDALTLEIAALDKPTRAQVARLERYGRLLEQVGTELGKFSAVAEIEMTQAARAAIDLASLHARGLAQASGGVVANWNRLNAGAVESLLGFLAPDGPLFARLSELAPRTADLVGKKLLEGVALGRGPRQLAAEITNGLGVGLTDSLRMTRTVTNYSYRESTRANYAANDDVIKGWYWFAELDGDVCLSCVAMHGTLHSTDEVLDDHHNGRCTMLPALYEDTANPVTQSGQEWFDALPAEQQRAMMGPGRHDAYSAGKFEFGALSATRTDAVYGTMRSEASLQELLGE